MKGSYSTVHVLPPRTIDHFTVSPHGGVRPFHQKSSCLTQLTLGTYVVQIWSRNTPESGPNETFVLYRVVPNPDITRPRIAGHGAELVVLVRCLASHTIDHSSHFIYHLIVSSHTLEDLMIVSPHIIDYFIFSSHIIDHFIVFKRAITGYQSLVLEGRAMRFSAHLLVSALPYPTWGTCMLHVFREKNTRGSLGANCVFRRNPKRQAWPLFFSLSVRVGSSTCQQDLALPQFFWDPH